MAIHHYTLPMIATALWLSAAAGRDTGGEFAVFSVGAHSCRDYLSARRNNGRAFKDYRQWLSGYLSAFNAIVTDTYDILGRRGGQDALDWLEVYCERNPDDSFINASAALTVTFYPQRFNNAPGAGYPGQWTRNDTPRGGDLNF